MRQRNDSLSLFEGEGRGEGDTKDPLTQLRLGSLRSPSLRNPLPLKKKGEREHDADMLRRAGPAFPYCGHIFNMLNIFRFNHLR